MLIVATVAWGIWGICDKLAVRTVHPAQVQMVNVVFATIALPVYYGILRGTGGALTWDARGLAWSLIGAVATGAASLAYIFALKQREASVVVSITSAYPAITFVVAAFALGEEVTPGKVAGLGLILSGVWMISR